MVWNEGDVGVKRDGGGGGAEGYGEEGEEGDCGFHLFFLCGVDFFLVP